jgi:hypothetical protein
MRFLGTFAHGRNVGSRSLKLRHYAFQTSEAKGDCLSTHRKPIPQEGRRPMQEDGSKDGGPVVWVVEEM